MSDKKHGPQPRAIALAVAVAIGLYGCGGGGGGNVRPSPAAPPPADGSNFSGGEVSVQADKVTEWSASISGPINLIKTGAGTLELTGANTYAGGTTISGGTLQIGKGGTTGSITGDVDDNGSLKFARSDELAFSGNISGTGSLEQAGAGTLILTGTNTYTGGTLISDGTLQVGNGGTIGSIIGDVDDNGSLRFARGDELAFSGNVSGTGSLEQAGSGALTLTGTNTYTGGTLISNGTLQVGNGGATGSIAGDVVDNGSLRFDRSDELAFSGNVSGTGSLEQAGSGTLVLTGSNTYTGGTLISDGTLQVGNGVTGSITGDVVDNGSLGFDRSDKLTFSGNISGTGSLKLSGSGTLTLTGANTYSGTTVVDDGTLRLGNGGTSGSVASDITLTDNGSVVFYRGDDVTYTGLISGNGTLNKTGGGLLRLTGASTFVGGTTVTGGILELSPGAALGTGAVQIGGFYYPEHTLQVDAGVTLKNHIFLGYFGTLDNAGVLGGDVDNVIEDDGSGTTLLNHDGGRITGTGWAVKFNNFATIKNSSGGVIQGDYLAIELLYGGLVTNDGSGSTISSTLGSAINASGADTTIENTGGAVISGAITLQDGGTVTNGSGSTILGSIMVATGHSSPATDGGLNLINAGTVTFGVVTDPTAKNSATLVAGGTIETNLLLGSNSRSTLTLTGDGSTQSYSNAVIGTTTFEGTLIKEGSGTWIIDNNDLQAVTDTSVNAGSLRATRALSGNVQVHASGNLEQVPGVTGDLSNAGKVLVREGDSTIGGNYVQASAGTLAVSLGSKLNVAGAATLNGGTLEVAGADDGYVSNTHTDVLTAAGGVSGTFDQLVKDAGVVFTSTTINYDANSVWLDTTGLDVTVAAAGNGVSYTPASMAAARRVQSAFQELDGKIATGGVSGVPREFLHSAGLFQQAPNLRAAQASLESLSGQLHATSAAMTLMAIDASSRALSDHMDNLLGNGVTGGTWTQELGTGGNMMRSGFDGIGFQLNGWLVGSDRKIGRSGVAGFAFGQSQGRQWLDRSFDRNDSRSTESMLYAGLLNGNWYTQGRVSFGRFRQDTNRQILLGYGAQGVSTQYDGHYNVAYGESGLHFVRGRSRLTPFVDVQYARIGRAAFAEQGAGGFGLRSNAQTLDRWQLGLGLRASHRWEFNDGRAVDFNARAQWQRTMASRGDVFEASFVGLQQWQPLAGIGLSRYRGLFGIGLDATLSAHTALKFGYDCNMGQHDHAQMLSARLDVAF